MCEGTILRLSWRSFGGVNRNWQFQSSSDHDHRYKQANRIKDGGAPPSAFCTDEKIRLIGNASDPVDKRGPYRRLSAASIHHLPDTTRHDVSPRLDRAAALYRSRP